MKSVILSWPIKTRQCWETTRRDRVSIHSVTAYVGHGDRAMRSDTRRLRPSRVVVTVHICPYFPIKADRCGSEGIVTPHQQSLLEVVVSFDADSMSSGRRGIGSRIAQVYEWPGRPAARELWYGPPGRERCLHTSARVWSRLYEPTWLHRVALYATVAQTGNLKLQQPTIIFFY